MGRIEFVCILEAYLVCAMDCRASHTSSQHFLHESPLMSNNPLLQVRGAVIQWQAHRAKVKFCTYTYRHMYVCVCILYIHMYTYTGITYIHIYLCICVQVNA